MKRRFKIALALSVGGLFFISPQIAGAGDCEEHCNDTYQACVMNAAEAENDCETYAGWHYDICTAECDVYYPVGACYGACYDAYEDALNSCQDNANRTVEGCATGYDNCIDSCPP